MKKIVGVVMMLAVVFAPVMPVMLATSGAWAACDPMTAKDENGKTCTPPPDTAILPNDWDIEMILKLVLNVVVYGLGVAAVLGVVIAGIMYMTARDNEAQATAARKRLIEIAIGLVAWALMYGVLNWLIPGGLNV